MCPPGRRISVIELAPDLLTAVGPRQALFAANNSGWELASFGPVVENPAPVKRGATYFLLYSGGAFNGAYGMGYASSSSATGPFVKAAENPVLAEGNGVISVGGGSLVTGPRGGTWLAYHGRQGSLRQSAPASDRPRALPRRHLGGRRRSYQCAAEPGALSITGRVHSECRPERRRA